MSENESIGFSPTSEYLMSEYLKELAKHRAVDDFRRELYGEWSDIGLMDRLRRLAQDSPLVHAYLSYCNQERKRPDEAEQLVGLVEALAKESGEWRSRLEQHISRKSQFKPPPW